MTAIDPLTYLDEVDARAEAATPGPWVTRGDRISKAVNSLAGPNVVGSARPTDAEFIASARSDLPALSKALRAALAINTGDNRTLYGNDFEAGMAKALWLVHEAIQAALAVNDEGGTT